MQSFRWQFMKRGLIPAILAILFALSAGPISVHARELSDDLFDVSFA